MQTVTFKNKTNTFVFFILIVLFSSVGIIAANSVFMVSNEIYSGVKIANISVGGLSVDQAEKKISRELAHKLIKPVLTVTYQDKSWDINADDIDYSIEYTLLADRAYQIGRQGSIFQQLKERYLSLNNGFNVPLSAKLNDNKLVLVFHKIADVIDREPQNAVLTIVGANKQVNPEVIGHKTNISKAVIDAQMQLRTGINVSTTLPVEQIMPEVFAKDFNKITGMISSYTTQFNPDNMNRTQNIVQAAQSVDFILIKSGDNFSFNDYVGLRLAAKGYKEAPVYIGNELVPGIGGGVCQVSTTLYNAALLANMSILERSPHIRPPSYVPLGQDATVADNLLDLVFKNTSDSNVYIRSYVTGNQLTVEFYGKVDNSKPNIEIETSTPQIIEPNTIVKQDDKLEFGKQVIEEEGQKGFIVTTFRVKTLNGREISKEHLATDEYAPVDKIIRIGTKQNDNPKKANSINK